MDTRIIPYDSDCVNDFFQDDLKPSINPRHLSNTLRDTYYAIQYKANLTGACYADVEYLAERFGISVSQAYRRVQQLRGFGLVIVKKKRGLRRLLIPVPYPDENATEMRKTCENNANPTRTRKRVSNSESLNSNMYVNQTDNEEVQSAQGQVTPMLPSTCADGAEVRPSPVDGDGTANEVISEISEEGKSVDGLRLSERPNAHTHTGVGFGSKPMVDTAIRRGDSSAQVASGGKSRNTTHSIPDCTGIAPGLHQNREEERNADKSRGTGCIDRNVKSVESRSRTDENSRAQTRTNAEITYSLLDNPRGDRVCREGAKTGIADTLIANGVDTREAVKLAAQFDSAHIRRCVLYLLQTEAKGHKVENRAGFLVAALRGGWAFKLCKQTPESIAKRHENARSCHAGSANEGRRYIPVPTKNYERTGADAPMSFLRGCLK